MAMKKIILWISILTLILGTAGVASATLINGGFEDGDFTGWTQTATPPTGAVLGSFPPGWAPLPFGPPPTMDSVKTNPIFEPFEGYKFAALQTGAIPNPGGDPAWITDLGSEPTLSQTVTMQAGYTLSGNAAFFTQEPKYVDSIFFDDRAYLKIFDSGGTEVAESLRWESSTASIIADVDGKDNHELYFDVSAFHFDIEGNPIIDDGTYVLDPVGFDPGDVAYPRAYVGGWSGWTYWEWTAPAAGDYTLTMGIINEDFYDGELIESVNSVAFLDNVVLTPEPATVLLLASGLGGLAGLRRKFKK